jgi:uncharacterized protein (TIGR02246 family)
MRIGCADLVDRYAQAVNEQDVGAFVDLFAVDAVWQRPGMTMHGREQIQAFIAQMFVPANPVRHVNGGVVVDVLGEGHARVRSITAVFDGEPALEGKVAMSTPAYLAEYDDVVVKVDGRWRFQRRQTTVTFVSAAMQPVPGIAPLLQGH